MVFFVGGQVVAVVQATGVTRNARGIARPDAALSGQPAMPALLPDACIILGVRREGKMLLRSIIIITKRRVTKSYVTWRSLAGRGGVERLGLNSALAQH